MKKTVYMETSVVSYRVAERSENIRIAEHQIAFHYDMEAICENYRRKHNEYVQRLRQMKETGGHPVNKWVWHCEIWRPLSVLSHTPEE